MLRRCHLYDTLADYRLFCLALLADFTPLIDASYFDAAATLFQLF